MKDLKILVAFPLLLLVNNLILGVIQFIATGNIYWYIAGSYTETNPSGDWWVSTNAMFVIQAIVRILLIPILGSLLLRRNNKWRQEITLLLAAFIWIECIGTILFAISESQYLLISGYFLSSHYLWFLYVPTWVNLLWALAILGIQWYWLRRYLLPSNSKPHTNPIFIINPALWIGFMWVSIVVFRTMLG